MPTTELKSIKSKDRKVIDSNCLFCNKVFQVRVDTKREGRGKFCSRSCSAQNSVRVKGLYITDKIKKYHCDNCGMEFQPQSQRKAALGITKYCSRSCSATHTQTKIIEKNNINPEKRFWDLVDIKEDKNECWEWKGYRHERGYGYFKYEPRGKLLKTHRIAYTISKGIIPEGLLVRHQCDNPPCCNPNHLLVGTNADNTKDKLERGRMVSQPGEKNHFHLLKAEQVIEIRKNYKFGGNAEFIATGKKYNVSRDCIYNIIHKKSWRSLLPETELSNG